MNKIQMKILGQCPSGKNSVIVTRSGKRFPSKRFVDWRSKALKEIKIDKGFKIIDKPCNVIVDYWSGDRRRRDIPGILDALWHLLEKAGVVTDDRYLGGDGCKQVFNNKGQSDDPRVEITIH